MSHKGERFVPKSEVALQFHIARALAIQHYANYEGSLSAIFAYLIGAPRDYAGVPFFKINNARARLAILDRLKKKRHPDKCQAFWASMMDLLPAFDQRRNEIVHWPTLGTINVDIQPGGQLESLVLVSPNFLDYSPDKPELTIANLYDFVIQGDYYTRLLNVFRAVISGGHASQSWLDICAEPVTYPPPANHPFAQN